MRITDTFKKIYQAKLYEEKAGEMWYDVITFYLRGTSLLYHTTEANTL